MPDYLILLLPQANYWDWVAAARDYVLKFGANLTSDPDSGGRYMTPHQVVIIAGAPNGYPAQGDIQQWYRRNYPSIRIDYLSAQSPAAFRSQLRKRIDANDPLAPLAPDFRRVWPAGVCLAGLHGRADGRMQAADFDVVAQARMEAVKLMSTAAPEDVDRLKAIRPDVFVMVRLFANFENRVVAAEDFAQWVTHDMGRFYQRGVRYYEIHNEPNLKVEGWMRSWQNGREFGAWWLTVRNRLKSLYPEAKFGWPGLSPDGFPMPERTNDMQFLRDAAEAVRAADWLGLHCYWRDEAEMNADAGGMGFREYRRQFPDKLLFVTEFSNPTHNVDSAAKGAQYVRYFRATRNEPGLGAVFAFVVSASANFPHEAWRFEDGQISGIVAPVAARA